jgi:hypothetical protein
MAVIALTSINIGSGSVPMSETQIVTTCVNSGGVSIPRARIRGHIYIQGGVGVTGARVRIRQINATGPIVYDSGFVQGTGVGGVNTLIVFEIEDDSNWPLINGIYILTVQAQGAVTTYGPGYLTAEAIP